MADSEVVVRYRGDSSDLEAAAKRMSAALDASTKTAAAGADKLNDSLEGVRTAITVSVTEEKKLAASILATKAITEQRAKALGLTVAELKKLDAQLASTAKQETRLGRAAADAGKQLEKSGGAIHKTAEAGGDAERAALGLADVLETVGLESAAAGTRLAANLGGGLEGIIKGGAGVKTALTAVAGAASFVAIAIAGGVAAYSTYANAADAARDEIRILDAAAAGLKTSLVGLTDEGISEAARAWGRFEASARKARDELDRIAGKTTDAQIQGRDRIEQLDEEAFVALRAAGQQVAAAERVIAIQREKIATGKLNLEEEVAAREAIEEGQKALKDAQGTLAARKAALEDARGAVAQLTEYNDALADSEDTVEKRDKAAAEAARLAAQTRAEQAAALREAASATAALDDITAAATAKTLDGYAAISFELSQQLEKIDALIAKGGDLEAADAARAAVADRANAATSDWIAGIADDMSAAKGDLLGVAAALDAVAKKAQEDASKLALEVGQAMVGAATDIAGALGSVFGEMLSQQASAIAETQAAIAAITTEGRDAERAALKEQLQEQKAAALKSFRAEKATKIAEALANGALAVSNVLAHWAWAPPVAAVLTGVAAATTTAQVAVIAAQPPPEYHTGGVVGPATTDPSERVIQARVGEAVLTQQGRRAWGLDSAADVAAANRGQGGGVSVVQLRVGARTMEEIVLGATGTTGAARRASRTQRPRGRRDHYGRLS